MSQPNDEAIEKNEEVEVEAVEAQSEAVPEEGTEEAKAAEAE